MKNILKDIPDAKLTPEREQELATRKDEDSLNELAMHSLREAFFYARRCWPGVESGELLSVCFTSLLAAARNFRPGRIRFFGFAKAHLRGALKKYARTQDVVKRGPRETEALPDVEEETEDSDDTTVHRRTAEPAATMPALEQIHIMELWGEVAPLLHKVLTPEEAMILELSFKGGLNLREIGELRGCSRAAMSLTKLSALKKLRRALLRAKKISSIDL